VLPLCVRRRSDPGRGTWAAPSALDFRPVCLVMPGGTPDRASHRLPAAAPVAVIVNELGAGVSLSQDCTTGHCVGVHPVALASGRSRRRVIVMSLNRLLRQFGGARSPGFGGSLKATFSTCAAPDGPAAGAVP
jgi:hypothetical protein